MLRLSDYGIGVCRARDWLVHNIVLCCISASVLAIRAQSSMKRRSRTVTSCILLFALKPPEVEMFSTHVCESRGQHSHCYPGLHPWEWQRTRGRKAHNLALLCDLEGVMVPPWLIGNIPSWNCLTMLINVSGQANKPSIGKECLFVVLDTSPGFVWQQRPYLLCYVLS